MTKWWRDLNTGTRLAFIVATVVSLSIVLGAIIVEVRDIYLRSSYAPEQIILVKPPDPRLRDLLWQLSELLIIPGTLVIIAYLLNQRLQERERRQREQAEHLAQIQREETILQNYIDRMTELLLKYGLRDSVEDNEICHIARTRTLTVLRGLTEGRKSSVVRFLYEAGLVNKKRRLVDLKQANLRQVKLRNAQLPGIALRRVRLNGSNLSGADLSEADLSYASLRTPVPEDTPEEPEEEIAPPTLLVKTNLREAILKGADLRKCNLKRSILQGADLSGTLLNEADLTNAILVEANLEGASLAGAKFAGADLAGASLAGATYDADTHWPEGYDPVANGAVPATEDNQN